MRRPALPAPDAIASGIGAHDERKRRHENRPKAQACTVECRLIDWTSALVVPLCELDDQDCVLCRQADEHDQADLDIDRVLHPADREGEERAEHGDRQA